eukprot:Skav227222  [mRNA]  locus=scaffold2048:479910:504782:- [translate_table: standard]
MSIVSAVSDQTLTGENFFASLTQVCPGLRSRWQAIEVQRAGKMPWSIRKVNMTALSALVMMSVAFLASACTDGDWTGFDQNAYAASLWGGSIGGIVVGLLMVILVSLPLCCGVLKKFGKVIAAIGIVLGLFALVIPYIGAMGSCIPFMEHVCADRCAGCTAEQEEVIAAIGIVLGLFALVIPYIGAMGSCIPFMEHVCADRCAGCRPLTRSCDGSLLQGLPRSELLAVSHTCRALCDFQKRWKTQVYCSLRTKEAAQRVDAAAQKLVTDQTRP